MELQAGATGSSAAGHPVHDCAERRTSACSPATFPSRFLQMESRFVYVARAGAQQLYVRPIDGIDARAVPSRGAPLISPDGQWIGFVTPAGSFKLPLSGGAATNIGPLTIMSSGAYWGTDGLITFGSSSGLQQVSNSGGTPKSLTQVQPPEVGHRMPHLLPGGQGGPVYIPGGQGESRIAVYSARTGERRDLIAAGTSPRYAASGHLVYARAGTLFAVPFDPNTTSIAGDPVPVLQGVMESATDFAYATVFPIPARSCTSLAQPEHHLAISCGSHATERSSRCQRRRASTTGPASPRTAAESPSRSPVRRGFTTRRGTHSRA